MVMYEKYPHKENKITAKEIHWTKISFTLDKNMIQNLVQLFFHTITNIMRATANKRTLKHQISAHSGHSLQKIFQLTKDSPNWSLFIFLIIPESLSRVIKSNTFFPRCISSIITGKLSPSKLSVIIGALILEAQNTLPFSFRFEMISSAKQFASNLNNPALELE